MEQSGLAIKGKQYRMNNLSIIWIGGITMIEVLFFAQLQEKVGSGKITIETDNISVQQLKTIHLAKYEIDDLLDEAMVAVNEEYASEDTVISTGDTVAFIPPVSGG